MATEIDVTPTWSMLLPMMLDAYETVCRKKDLKFSFEDPEAYTNLRTEFKRMAQAADKWNEYAKTKKIVKTKP